MNCPQCTNKLQETEVKTNDGQQAMVHECYSCGGHFFPSLVANFTDTKTATDLDSIIPKDQAQPSPNHSYKCPICQTTLTNIKDDAVPQNLTIYACPENHGHFFPKGQLLSFKKAQKAKLSYHQIWGIPLKSAFAILLPVIAIFTLVGLIPLTINEINKRQESRISASSPINKPIITPAEDNQYILSFTTKYPVNSELTLTAPNQPALTLTISATPKSTHIITLTQLQPATTYTYTITIENDNTPPITSQEYTLTTP